MIKLHTLKGYIYILVRLIDSLLKFADCEEDNRNGILLTAIIEKAFDSVDHNFISHL